MKPLLPNTYVINNKYLQSILSPSTDIIDYNFTPDQIHKLNLLQITLDNGDPKNSHYCEYISSNSIFSKGLVNKDELFKFIEKKSFDNRSDFQYYPFKLFQEVLINE